MSLISNQQLSQYPQRDYFGEMEQSCSAGWKEKNQKFIKMAQTPPRKKVRVR